MKKLILPFILLITAFACQNPTGEQPADGPDNGFHINSDALNDDYVDNTQDEYIHFVDYGARGIMRYDRQQCRRFFVLPKENMDDYLITLAFNSDFSYRIEVYDQDKTYLLTLVEHDSLQKSVNLSSPVQNYDLTNSKYVFVTIDRYLDDVDDDPGNINWAYGFVFNPVD